MPADTYPSDPEGRLTRLEEALYFQEKLLDDLNDALRRQQRQIDQLEASTSQALRRLEALMQEATSPDGRPAPEQPPHYGPRW